MSDTKGKRDENTENMPLNEGKKEGKEEQHKTGNAYARFKTAGEGLMDFGLIMANTSQLKAVIENGEAYKFYVPLIVLIVVCLLLQLVVGVLILILSFKLEDKEDNPKANYINMGIVGLITIITVLNMAIGVIGLSSPKT